MRVTHRTPDILVIEDGPDVRLGWVCAAFGAAGLLVASSQSSWIFGLVGSAFMLFGLKVALFARTTTHRFEHGRERVMIETTKRRHSGSRRELPLGSISDVVLRQKQVRGGEAGLRYWVEYVTTGGESIAWSGFTGSKDDKVECVIAVREFLGIGPAIPVTATTVPIAAEGPT